MLPLPEYLVGYLSAFVQIGVLLLGMGLLVAVRFSLRQPLWDAWSQSLAAYGAAVVALTIGSLLAGPAGGTFVAPSIAVYMSLEYLALGSLIAGARGIAGRPAWPRLLIAAVALAALIAFGSEPYKLAFEARYTAHAGVLALFFGWGAWQSLAVSRRLPGIGIRIIALACILLALDYGQYVGALIITGHFLSGWVALDTYLTVLLDMVLAVGMVVLSADRAHQQLHELASSDALSGVQNRAAFAARLEQPPPTGVVAMIDVDHLKALNDRYGHRSGDRAITTIAAALKRASGNPQTIFRVGGDEFVWIVPAADARTIDERLGRLNEELAFVVAPERGRANPLSITWGVAQFARGVTIEEAMAEADGAMYVRKAQRGTAV